MSARVWQVSRCPLLAGCPSQHQPVHSSYRCSHLLKHTLEFELSGAPAAEAVWVLVIDLLTEGVQMEYLFRFPRWRIFPRNVMSCSLACGEKWAHVSVILAWSFSFLHSFCKRRKNSAKKCCKIGMCAYYFACIWAVFSILACLTAVHLRGKSFTLIIAKSYDRSYPWKIPGMRRLLSGEEFHARNAGFFYFFFFVRDHRAAHQLSHVLCVCKDIPWIPFLAIFLWNIQCLKSETAFLCL